MHVWKNLIIMLNNIPIILYFLKDYLGRLYLNITVPRFTFRKKTDLIFNIINRAVSNSVDWMVKKKKLL